MTTTALPLPGRPARMPTLGWWIVLGAVLALSLGVSWIAGVGVLALALIQRARPFDFISSYLIVVAVASFTDYLGGRLTYELGVLTILIIFSLFCYLLSRRHDALTFPVTPAFLPLVLFLGLTLVNFVRGVVVGNVITYAGLELLAVLAIASCLIVGSRRWNEREIMVAVFALWIVGLGHFAYGCWAWVIFHVRRGGTYFLPATGLIAVLMLNFALREPRKSRAALWVLAIGPLVFHQILSFTRGFWLALCVSIPFTIIGFAGRGPGARERWSHCAWVVGLMTVLGIVGVVVVAGALGLGDLGAAVTGRFSSSFETQYDTASMSNFVRIAESLHVIGEIIANPWFGYGIGYSFVAREIINFQLHKQWYVHENYLLVTLKQGLIGLGLWIWLMIAFLSSAVRGRNLPSPIERAWCMGTAAMCVYLIVYQFVYFPLAEVNTAFMFALALGVMMGLTRTRTLAIRWKAPDAAAAP